MVDKFVYCLTAYPYREPVVDYRGPSLDLLVEKLKTRIVDNVRTEITKERIA